MENKEKLLDLLANNDIDKVSKLITQLTESEKEKIKLLSKFLSSNDEIGLIEYEDFISSIRIVKKGQSGTVVNVPAIEKEVQTVVNVPSNANHVTQQNVKTESKVIDAVQEQDLYEITAPMVGTFYRAPSPDAKPYVEVDQHIAKGDVLCIIEAMKIMNEIESDVSGTVVEIKVKNAQPIEFGQVLFLIKKDD